MQIAIEYRPANSLARVHLAAGESVVAEGGAMVGMTTNVDIQTESGGFASGLKRMFGGESFFRNTFTARQDQAELLLAHSMCGDMMELEMTPQGYILQSEAFIASTPDVQIDTKVGGFRSLFAGEGLFLLQATSQQAGRLLIGAFGGIEEMYCNGSMVVDTGHLVAWDATLDYSVGRSTSGLLASWLSGEGIVCHFQGQGRIWIQSRNPDAFGQTVGRLLPPRKQ